MAVARPATTECLLQKDGRPLCFARCASSRAQGRHRPPGWRIQWAAAQSTNARPPRCISGRCIALPASAHHRRQGLAKYPDLHGVSSHFHILTFSMAYDMLPCNTFLWYMAGVLYHRCAIYQVAISHLTHTGMCYIADCHTTPFLSYITPFLWYIPHDKWCTMIAPDI